jgi:hypothetical protein
MLKWMLVAIVITLVAGTDAWWLSLALLVAWLLHHSFFHD